MTRKLKVPGRLRKAEETLNKQDKIMSVRARQANKRVQALLAAKQKELQQKMQTEWLQEELEARKLAGSHMKELWQIWAMRALAVRLSREVQAERARLSKIHGNVFDDGKGA